MVLRNPVLVWRPSAISGMEVNQRMARLVTPRKAMPSMSHQWGAPMGTSNQMVRRSSRACSPAPGLLMAGYTSMRGMNNMTFTTPTTANSSETRVNGRRQWLLVKRNVTAARGAPEVTMNTKKKPVA